MRGPKEAQSWPGAKLKHLKQGGKMFTTSNLPGGRLKCEFLV